MKLQKHNNRNFYIWSFHFRNGNKLATYKEPRTFGELYEFVRRMQFNVAEDYDETVAELDRDNFEDRTGEVEWTFVHFHTDWCRHCKYVAETWEELAERYKGRTKQFL